MGPVWRQLRGFRTDPPPSLTVENIKEVREESKMMDQVLIDLSFAKWIKKYRTSSPS